MKSYCWSSIPLTLSLLASVVAQAQTSAPDAVPVAAPVGSRLAGRAVFLKDGSRLTGQLVAFVPEQHITLRVLGGALKTIPLVDVARIEDHALSLAPPPPEDPDEVDVSIQADQPITLSAMTLNGEPRKIFSNRQEIHVALPLSAQYKVSGPGFPSNTFRLLPERNVRVDIRTGSRAGLAGGGILIGLGGAAAVSGVASLLFGGLLYGLGSIGHGGTPNLTPYWVVAGVGGVTGLPCLAAGMVLLLRSGTKVRVSSDDGSAAVRLASGARLSARGLEF